MTTQPQTISRSATTGPRWILEAPADYEIGLRIAALVSNPPYVDHWFSFGSDCSPGKQIFSGSGAPPEHKRISWEPCPLKHYSPGNNAPGQPSCSRCLDGGWLLRWSDLSVEEVVEDLRYLIATI